MSAWTVRYRLPTSASIVSMDVLAPTASEAVEAARALVPTLRLVETRGAHWGLDNTDALTPCTCGHAAKLHTTDEYLGDQCEHVGYGHGNGVRHSMHPCSCQGFWPVTTD